MLNQFPRFWETPEFTQINRLPARAWCFPFHDAQSALTRDPARSRWVRSLDGAWSFKLFDRPEAALAAVAGAEDESWRDIQVPGNWTMQGYDKPHYTNAQMPFKNDPPYVPDENPTGIYRRTIRMARDWQKRRTILCVGGAESVLCVYLNGTFVGMSKDSRLPAEFDLTPFLKKGDNELALLVIRWSDASYLEDQDHWWMAGVHRSVYLYSVAFARLRDLFARATPDRALRSGTLTLDAELDFQAEPKQDYTVQARLLDADGREVLKKPLEGRVSSSYRQGYHSVTLDARVPRIKPWSAEKPYLYTLLVALLEADGTAVEHTALRVGFRRIEVRDRKLLINGQPVYIKGVNRHDHNHRTGKAVTEEDMRREAYIMKAFHFNAVRTAHYPNDPRWYELCDEVGLYVVDEANIENHDNYAMMNKDPRWATAYFERCARMVERDKNYACIFSWSLGNESGYGDNHDRVADWMRDRDPTRILHNENALKDGYAQFMGNNYGPGGERSNDLINPMYPSLKEMVEWTQTDEDTTRPFIACEYSHGMGNSNGGLWDYWQAIYTLPGLQGGFIWDWMEQGLIKTLAPEGADWRPGPDVKGTVDELKRDLFAGQPRWYWAYGGDFGDEPNDKNFCCNGMIWPDGTPKPSMQEFKRIAQPLSATLLDKTDQGARVAIRNRDFFQNANWLSADWVLETGGRTVASGTLPRLNIPAQREKNYEIKWPAIDAVSGEGETYLTLHYRYREDFPWVSAGEEAGWDQFLIASGKRTTRRRGRHDGARLVSGEKISKAVSATGVTVRLDHRTGRVVDWQLQGKTVLSAGPQLNVLRGWTDNDGVKGREDQWSADWKPLGRWMNAGLDQLEEQLESFEVRVVGSSVEWTSRHRYATPTLPDAILHTQQARLRADGTLTVDQTFRVHKALPDLPRIGMRCTVAPAFHHLAWFGLGPHETYIDRKYGARMGRYEGLVSDQYVPYIVPQEHGNMEDLRWLTLTDEQGLGMMITAGKPFSGSASHFRLEDLIAAYHTHELKPRPEIELCVDIRQRGLGTASCGPDTLEPYWVKPGVWRQQYELIPVIPDA